MTTVEIQNDDDDGDDDDGTVVVPIERDLDSVINVIGYLWDSSFIEGVNTPIIDKTTNDHIKELKYITLARSNFTTSITKFGELNKLDYNNIGVNTTPPTVAMFCSPSIDKPYTLQSKDDKPDLNVYTPCSENGDVLPFTK